MMTYICFFAFDKTLFLNIKDGIYTMVIGGYGMMLPSLGGTGTYHTLVGSGLELLNIDPNIANAFTLILHGAQSIMTISSWSRKANISYYFIHIERKKSNRYN